VGWSNTGFSFRNDSYITVTLTNRGPNDNLLNASIQRDSYNPTTISNFLPNLNRTGVALPGRNIDEIRLFVAGTDNSDTKNFLYFNNLAGYSAYRL
jgi:hypothetical protein